jgi:hypothetical protein
MFQDTRERMIVQSELVVRREQVIEKLMLEIASMEIDGKDTLFIRRRLRELIKEALQAEQELHRHGIEWIWR